MELLLSLHTPFYTPFLTVLEVREKKEVAILVSCVIMDNMEEANVDIHLASFLQNQHSNGK